MLPLPAISVQNGYPVRRWIAAGARAARDFSVSDESKSNATIRADV
jgi:hypothetical protein